MPLLSLLVLRGQGSEKNGQWNVRDHVSFLAPTRGLSLPANWQHPVKTVVFTAALPNLLISLANQHVHAAMIGCGSDYASAIYMMHLMQSHRLAWWHYFTAGRIAVKKPVRVHSSMEHVLAHRSLGLAAPRCKTCHRINYYATFAASPLAIAKPPSYSFLFRLILSAVPIPFRPTGNFSSMGPSSIH